jgi:ACS family tartrate transporter-like MFS transporter
MPEVATSAGLSHEITDLERQTMARVARRLLPLLIACYFIAYLDRVNVGFASLTMNKALGFSSAVYGFGGGIFFLGYFIFEVPSNVLLSKVGARLWIARILITWGIISGCTAFITGPLSFYSVRFLLGIAEAGFFPGIILYLTW